MWSKCNHISSKSSSASTGGIFFFVGKVGRVETVWLQSTSFEEISCANISEKLLNVARATLQPIT